MGHVIYGYCKRCNDYIDLSSGEVLCSFCIEALKEVD